MQADLQERDRDPILSRHPKRHATRSPIHPCHLGAGAGPSAAAVWRALRASVRTPQGRARCRRASARLLQDCDVEGSRPPAAACGCIRPLTNSTAAGAGPIRRRLSSDNVAPAQSTNAPAPLNIEFRFAPLGEVFPTTLEESPRALPGRSSSRLRPEVRHPGGLRSEARSAERTCQPYSPRPDQPMRQPCGPT